MTSNGKQVYQIETPNIANNDQIVMKIRSVVKLRRCGICDSTNIWQERETLYCNKCGAKTENN